MNPAARCHSVVELTAGFSSRAPEAKLSELLNAGITTVVGLTGTDSISRCQVQHLKYPLP